jgi:hypothetical protein
VLALSAVRSVAQEDGRAAEGAAAMKERQFRIPEGWTLEMLLPSKMLLRTPPPLSYMATLDFCARGFRSGLSSSGRFVGEKLTKRGYERKKYGGRGWEQALVDDAVTWLEALLLSRPHRKGASRRE